MIKLSFTFPEVFKTYKEELTISSISFSGILNDRFEGESDDTLIHFIAGGRVPLAYDLDREGAKVKGKIYFRDLDLDNPDESIEHLGKVDKYWANKNFDERKAFSDRDKEKIILLKEKGISVIDIAEYFDVHRMTIYKVLKEREKKND